MLLVVRYVVKTDYGTNYRNGTRTGIRTRTSQQDHILTTPPYLLRRFSIVRIKMHIRFCNEMFENIYGWKIYGGLVFWIFRPEFWIKAKINTSTSKCINFIIRKSFISEGITFQSFSVVIKLTDGKIILLLFGKLGDYSLRNDFLLKFPHSLLWNCLFTHCKIRLLLGF